MIIRWNWIILCIYLNKLLSFNDFYCKRTLDSDGCLLVILQPGQTYSYEQSAYPATSLGAAGIPQTATYAQADYGQPAYTVQGTETKIILCLCNGWGYFYQDRLKSKSDLWPNSKSKARLMTEHNSCILYLV